MHLTLPSRIILNPRNIFQHDANILNINSRSSSLKGDDKPALGAGPLVVEMVVNDALIVVEALVQVVLVDLVDFVLEFVLYGCHVWKVVH